MKLSHLKDLIEELEQEFPDTDPEVVLGTQPDYPMEAHVGGFAIAGEDEDRKVVICEGRQIGYGSKSWWENLLSA